PPPRDESSDSVSSDSESEDEEADIAPEATARTVAQRSFAIRDFSRGIVEVGESSATRDSSYIGGLAPWALRRDLETSRARARLIEAELSTTQVEIALLKSKNKIGEKERKLLDHDLGDIVMDNQNSPNEPNEDILEENPIIPKPNHVEDAHDPNELVDILDDEDLVDYDRDDEEPEEELKEEP
nr:hypothetical protein [Tanacetum cinerariifolium]